MPKNVDPFSAAVIPPAPRLRNTCIQVPVSAWATPGLTPGSGVRRVVTGPAVDEKPAWSPDGRQLMIISNRDGSGEPRESLFVHLVDLDGGEAQPLGLTANVVLTPVWSYR
jgi:TolB protein